MAMSRNRLLAGAFISLLIASTALFTLGVQSSNAEDSDLNVNYKLTEFLSSVFGLDLTKYAFTLPNSSTPRYPQELGGTVREQVLSPKLESDEGTMGTMSTFYNGQLWSIKISPGRSSVIYSEPPPTDILSQTKSILEKYQAFVNRVYATDGSFLVPMQNILSGVNDLSPMNVTEGNLNFQVTQQNGNKTRIQWIYTEGGVLMDHKRVELSFQNSTFVSFIDGWSLYKVSGLSLISSEEAVQIAFGAAKNFEFHLVYDEQVGPVSVKPELTYENHIVTFGMAWGRSYNGSNPSIIPRDALTLYPQWQVLFLLNQSYGGNDGVQVGVWGDTQEIVSCTGYGSLGVMPTPSSSPEAQPESSPSSELTSPSSSPTQQPSASSPNQQTGFLGTNIPAEYSYVIVAIAVIAVVAGLSLVYVKKLRKQKQ
jgi:hypothetical protein